MLKKIKFPIIIFLALLLVVGVVAFAWFFENNVIKVQSDDNFAITVGTDLQVALKSDGVYTNTLTLPTKDLTVADCTSDGETFITFKSLNAQDEPIVEGYQIISEEDMEDYCIELELLVKTSNAISVYLGQDSAVSPRTETNVGGMYPNVNKDLIAGCARVAFIEVHEDGTEELKCVWAPNSRYELINDNFVYSAKKDGKREDSYGYFGMNESNSGVEKKTYSAADILTGKFLLAENGSLCSSSNVGLSPKLLTFDKEGVEQIKELKIRIWFEGTDREAHAAMNNGQVNYLINLMGFKEKEYFAEDGAEVEMLKGIKASYNSGTDKVTFTDAGGAFPSNVVYSTDLIDWTPLGAENAFSMAAGSGSYRGETIYFRLAEDANHYIGTDIVYFQMPETNWTAGQDPNVHDFVY